MATSNNFQTQNSCPILLCLYVIFFLFLLSKVNSIETVSFGFIKFEPDQQDLLLQGDTVVTSTGKLQLTKVENDRPVTNSVGRVLYSEPIHIWDSTTGNVASFFTQFSFIINATNKNDYGDGLAFFLASVDTQPQSPGGLLGLFKDQNYNKSNQIVSVEFDTFSNEAWDPKGTHFGINANSIKSIETTLCRLDSGKVVNVILVYQPHIRCLNAFLILPFGESYVIDATVDVKEILPEYVRIGFSAATGDYVQTHEILSWGFESMLPESDSDVLEVNKHISRYIPHVSM